MKQPTARRAERGSSAAGERSPRTPARSRRASRVPSSSSSRCGGRPSVIRTRCEGAASSWQGAAWLRARRCARGLDPMWRQLGAGQPGTRPRRRQAADERYGELAAGRAGMAMQRSRTQPARGIEQLRADAMSAPRVGDRARRNGTARGRRAAPAAVAWQTSEWRKRRARAGRGTARARCGRRPIAARDERVDARKDHGVSRAIRGASPT